MMMKEDLMMMKFDEDKEIYSSVCVCVCVGGGGGPK